MLQGFLELPLWGLVAVTLLMTHLTIICVTVYLHRHQAHRALDLHPALAHFFRLWLWLTTGMSTRAWVAVHRKHHARCETAEDPHSPQVLGLRKVLLEGAELYQQAAAEPDTLRRYAHGTPDDWLERHVYSRMTWQGLAIMGAIDLLLFGVAGITIWAVQMLWIPLLAAGVVNGVGHYMGYRNFEPSDASRNIIPWGILIGGEELHNNHHAYPSSARLSARAWEFDLGWTYIKLFERLGLARVKRTAPVPVIGTPRPQVDHDVARAVASSRLHVMASYGRQVLLPTLKREIIVADASCRRLFRAARRSLLREAGLVDQRAWERLNAALAASRELKVTYDFKLRLQTLWDRSITTPDALVKRLQEWCNEAEATGIRALENYAHYLRGYTLAAQGR